MEYRSLTGRVVLVLITGLLTACGSGSAIKSNTGIGSSTGFGTSKSHALSGQQRRIVDAAVRQIIKDQGTATIQSMEAAASKQADRTDVCGYVTYAVPVAGNSVGAAPAATAPTQVRYFIQLGTENGKQAALMGQVASDPARRAKVAFMCKRAGLE